MFVYGPPGNGKTVISQAIRNVLGGEIAIPHALEVEGSIIRVFDPVIHEELELPETGSGLDGGVRHDRRWARCKRPMVMVGGELKLSALDLSDSRGIGLLPRADSDGGQWRSARHRRLRPAAVFAS